MPPLTIKSSQTVAPPSNHSTLDQQCAQRAQHAWNAVDAVVKAHVRRENDKPVPDDIARKFGGQAKKLPVRILASGLGQALAFLKAKDDAPDLVSGLSEWIAIRIAPKANEPRDLLERVIQGESDFLRRATDEVLAYLQWINRFAEAQGLTKGDSE